jgi:hypothetical protein
MIHSQLDWFKPAKQLMTALSCSAALCCLSSPAFAQDRSEIREHYPQLADLFNAFDVTQANALDRIADINANPAYTQARAELREHMDMMKNMTMSEMMAAGTMDHSMMMSSTSSGPFVDLEVEARINLLETMRGKHSDEEAEAAFNNAASIDRHTAEVFKRGRNFESKLFAIYVDDSITNKRAAVAEAITDYLSDDRHSVATFPKESSYLIDHPYATGLKTAFPRLSGFLWSQQWLQLASLEAVILQSLDSQAKGGVDIALERFWNKIGSVAGMSMFPPPSELPMAPAIAPDLYSQSPEAALILDNLNILETIIADILAYPNVDDRETAMSAAVALFTNKEMSDTEPMEYLLFALRGGIYDQGGPAVGDLSQSERNRSRSAMNMQHTMIMSSPQ